MKKSMTERQIFRRRLLRRAVHRASGLIIGDTLSLLMLWGGRLSAVLEDSLRRRILVDG